MKRGLLGIATAAILSACSSNPQPNLEPTPYSAHQPVEATIAEMPRLESSYELPIIHTDTVEHPKPMLSPREQTDLEGFSDLQYIIDNTGTGKIFDFLYSEASRDSVYFFDEESGELIGTFPTRGRIRGNRDYLRGSAVQKTAMRLPQKAMGSGNKNWTRKRFLENGYDEVAYFVGKKESVRARKESVGMLLEEYQKHYQEVGVPGNFVGHLIIESNLNRKVKSYAARGIGQIGYRRGACCKDQGLAKQLRRYGIHYEWPDGETQAALSAAGIAVETKLHGSKIEGIQAYHSGGVNNERLMINGGDVVEGDIMAQYVAGLAITPDLPKMYRFSFGKASSWYVSQVAGIQQTVNEIIDEVPQVSTFTYQVTENEVTLSEFRNRTGLSTREARFYNPHLINKVVKGGILHVPEETSSLGRRFEYCEQTPKTQGVMNAWRTLTIDSWDEDAIDQLEFFQDAFADVGCYTMAAAIPVFGIDFINAVRRSRRKGSVQDTLLIYENDEARKARVARIAASKDTLDINK